MPADIDIAVRRQFDYPVLNSGDMHDIERSARKDRCEEDAFLPAYYTCIINDGLLRSPSAARSALGRRLYQIKISSSKSEENCGSRRIFEAFLSSQTKALRAHFLRFAPLFNGIFVTGGHSNSARREANGRKEGRKEKERSLKDGRKSKAPKKSILNKEIRS